VPGEALDQIPALAGLFLGANVGFIAWYVGLFLHFRITGGRRVPDDELEGALLGEVAAA